VKDSEGQVKASPDSTPVPSSPQCCHCGYRGGHADDCPFKVRYSASDAWSLKY
jgi:hypothetical protein